MHATRRTPIIVPVLHPRRVAAPEEGELPLVDTPVDGVGVDMGVDVGVDVEVGVAVPLSTTMVVGVAVPLITTMVGVAVAVAVATGRTAKVRLTVP